MTPDKLIIYRCLLDDPIIKQYTDLIASDPFDQAGYYKLLNALVIEEIYLVDHIISQLVHVENNFTVHLESGQPLNANQLVFLKHDLRVIKALIDHPISAMEEQAKDSLKLLSQMLYHGGSDPIVKAYHEFFAKLDVDYIHDADCNAFADLAHAHGVGAFAFHAAFIFNRDNQLDAIKSFNPLPWEDIYAYTYQKDQLFANTKAFLAGSSFHHALLVGNSGTGKSSSVKALVAKLAHKKLRLIQMQKGQLHHLPKVLKKLSNRVYKFILFIDDLSFEANEDEYKFLKSFIEGGITNTDGQIAFYVTSNRRHLIKEIRSERENDIHLTDFIQEMTSLSDRFGLTLFYEAPTQRVYVEMLQNMLLKHDLILSEEQLLVQARQWALSHGGMSGRTAEQFIKHLEMLQGADSLS